MSFNRFVRAKIEVQDKVVNAGFHLLFSDVDVVWTDNALPELLSYPKQGYFMKEADEYAKTPKCVAQSLPTSTHRARPLELTARPRWGGSIRRLRSRHEANTGFFMLQRGPAQAALHKRMYQIERQRDVHDDQKLVSRLEKFPLLKRASRVSAPPHSERQVGSGVKRLMKCSGGCSATDVPWRQCGSCPRQNTVLPATSPRTSDGPHPYSPTRTRGPCPMAGVLRPW